MTLVKLLVSEFLGKVARAEIRERLEAARPRIVARMAAKGVTPEAATVPLVVRDALFRLIRVVIPSGDVSDLIRDKLSQAITEKVIGKLAGSITAGRDLDNVVGLTADALIEHVF